MPLGDSIEYINELLEDEECECGHSLDEHDIDGCEYCDCELW